VPQIPQERLDAFRDKIARDVERVGWSSVSVFPNEEGGPTFTYTIGLPKTLGHPELILYGLPSSQAHGILASAIDEIRSGATLEPGKRYSRVLREFDVEVRACHPSGRPLNAARGFAGGDVEAVQIVWPDPEGRFPSDPDVDPAYALVQEPVDEEPEP
jgi:hypothetical protein